MATNDLIPYEENKHYCICYQSESELKELKDQISCLQRSVATFRNYIPELAAKRPRK